MNLWDPTCFRLPVCLLLIPLPLFLLFFSPECTLQGTPAHAGGQAEASDSG